MEATKDVFRIFIGLFMIGMFSFGFYLVGSVIVQSIPSIPPPTPGIPFIFISTLVGFAAVFWIIFILWLAHYLGKSIL